MLSKSSRTWAPAGCIHLDEDDCQCLKCSVSPPATQNVEIRDDKRDKYNICAELFGYESESATHKRPFANLDLAMQNALSCYQLL